MYHAYDLAELKEIAKALPYEYWRDIKDNLEANRWAQLLIYCKEKQLI